jgi:hypothetical protein
MEQNPWEADSRTSCQEIPRLLCKPEVHYRFHRSQLLDSTLNQMNRDYTLKSYLLKDQFSYFHPI